MKDIKSLYNLALIERSSRNIDEYRNAINYIIENKPYDYVSNLEYIITSSIGIQTLEYFIKTYGLSIPLYEKVVVLLDRAVNKCEKRGVDKTLFEEAFNMIENYYNNHSKYFHMFEYYNDIDSDEYNKLYYSFNEHAIQNSKIPSIMLNNFKEAAIPDLLIKSKDMKNNKSKLITMIMEKLDNKLLNEWIYTIETNHNNDKDLLNKIYENTLSKYITDIKNKTHKMYRESIITGENNLYEYTANDIDIIQDMISFREYNSLYDSSYNIESICEMYEMLPPELFGESDADIVQMLPGSYKESETTSNKTSGTSPDYIKKNHTMAKWGEEDNDKGSKNDDGNSDNDIDIYKRPSTMDNKPSGDNRYVNDDLENTTDGNAIEPVKDDDGAVDKHTGGNITNYYYYTYKNSYNKNQNSYNKNNSRNDDHSTHTTYNNHNYTKSENYEFEDTFKLDIFDNDYIQEGFMDKIKSFASKVKGFIVPKMTLGHLQKLDIQKTNVAPPTLTIIGTNIPILPNKSFKESTISETNDSINFNENAINKFLSETDVQKVVNNFSKKINMPIYFNNSEFIKNFGGAAVIIADKDTISKVKNNEEIDMLNFKSIMNGDEGADDRVLVVDTKFLVNSNISSAKDLEIVLSHEYGHVLTMDQFNSDDWVEYQYKRNLMLQLLGTFYIAKYDDYLPELNVFGYHQLKPERAANEAMGIDPRDLIKVIFNKYCAKNTIDAYDLQKIVNYEFPKDIIELCKKSMKGDVNVEYMRKLSEFSIQFFNDVVKPSKRKDALIESINEQLALYQNMNESTGDADDRKPDSDHPVTDVLIDIDREVTKHGQNAKKKVQDVVRTGKAMVKPIKRLNDWITNMVNQWKDIDENKIKEKMADPRQRKNLYDTIKKAILGGSLLKAGLLLNPIFLFLAITKTMNDKHNAFRLRNEMIGELKTEIEIIDEKIKDADNNRDTKAKYKLMRFKNEMNKKLMRVGGGKEWSKIL